jgi:hypothetical protein
VSFQAAGPADFRLYSHSQPLRALEMKKSLLGASALDGD